MRVARPADAERVQRLAELDGRRVPAGTTAPGRGPRRAARRAIARRQGRDRRPVPPHDAPRRAARAALSPPAKRIRGGRRPPPRGAEMAADGPGPEPVLTRDGRTSTAPRSSSPAEALPVDPATLRRRHVRGLGDKGALAGEGARSHPSRLGRGLQRAGPHRHTGRRRRTGPPGDSGGSSVSGSTYERARPACRTPKCRCGSAADRFPLVPISPIFCPARTGSPRLTATLLRWR